MADVQQADNGLDLHALMGGPDPAVVSGLADLERKKIGADEAISAKSDKTLDADRARIEHAYNAEGVTAADIKPWDAKAEEAKTAYDPIQAFGSVGSVFALLASAFTHQPMQNALNGAAAAMNAVKQGKTEEYKRAYEAWKANTDLALKRHEMMHEQYVDANELLKTNLAAGRAKMMEVAAKFGDQKTLFLLEHGMDKELIDMQTARQESALKMAKAWTGIEEDHIKLSSLLDMKDENGKQLYDPQQPGSPRTQRAIKAWHEMWSPYAGHPQSADQQFLEQFHAENPNATAEQTVKAFGEWKQAQKAGGPAGNTNMGKEKAAAVEEMLKKNPDMSRTEAIQKVSQAAQPLASTRVDDIRQSVDRIDTAEHIMDKIETLLKKHNAITGFGGHITRTGETLAEILGADSSDFKEFHRLVSTLQTLGPRVLLDSKGRPIGAETGKIDEVFAGNNFGDLNQNTLRAYKELRDIFEFQKKKYRARLPGSDSSQAPGTSGDTGDKWWESPAAGRVK